MLELMLGQGRERGLGLRPLLRVRGQVDNLLEEPLGFLDVSLIERHEAKLENGWRPAGVGSDRLLVPAGGVVDDPLIKRYFAQVVEVFSRGCPPSGREVFGRAEVARQQLCPRDLPLDRFVVGFSGQKAFVGRDRCPEFRQCPVRVSDVLMEGGQLWPT